MAWVWVRVMVPMVLVMVWVVVLMVLVLAWVTVDQAWRLLGAQ